MYAYAICINRKSISYGNKLAVIIRMNHVQI